MLTYDFSYLWQVTLSHAQTQPYNEPTSARQDCKTNGIKALKFPGTVGGVRIELASTYQVLPKMDNVPVPDEI